MKVVIFAGGLGTRMAEETVVRPKHGPLRHPGEYAVESRKRRKDAIPEKDETQKK